MTDRPQPLEVPGIPAEVLERIVAELGNRGDTVIDCLRTAVVLITQAGENGAGLRLAESAAYNLREALDAIVAGRPAPEGGVAAAIEAWKRYQMSIRGLDEDLEAARADLEIVLERLEQDEERQAFKTRKLLEYVRDQTGVDPLPGEDDPTVRYARLRDRANRTLHGDGTVPAVAAMYDEVAAWLIRFFTPPDDRVTGLADLAERPYAEGLVDELRKLVLNSHHLGLFFSRLQDPAWLDPLHDAGLIPLPRDGEPWPVTFLVGGAGRIGPTRVADVLDRLLGDAKHLPEPLRLGVARHILQDASRLGTAGHDLTRKIIAKYPTDHWVQTIAVSVAKDTDPTDPIQVAIADAVVANGRNADRGYQTRTVLDRLAEGLTKGNVAARLEMMAAKVRRLASDQQMRYVVLDIAALDTAGDDLREPVLILAQHLTAMLPRARDFGLSTAEILKLVDGIPGELGERLICQALAGADDVDRSTKITHIERRMSSETATGDDRNLIVDILKTPMSPDELARWQAALGVPSPAPDTDAATDALGDNWARAWRWSMVLPAEVLESWREAIAAVTALHGAPSPTSLDTRIPRFMSGTARSPYTRDELAALPVLEAAALISSWRPRSDDGWGVSALELARELEALVKENPRAWTEDPTAVVTTLREPVYVDHYLRAVAHCVSDLADRAGAVLTAIELVRTEKWEPTPIGRDNYHEPDWSVVDTLTVEVIAAFANKSGELAPDIDMCWARASELVRRLPEELPGIEVYVDASEVDDPLNRAINRPYGKALQAVLALGGWEHRNHGTASGRVNAILDHVLAVPGAVGLELRSVLASSRPFLETVAPEWLDARADELFGPSPLGTITFDQTLKWSRPTSWFYRRYRSELIAAACRGADHSLAWLLIAYLWDEPNYTFANLIGGLAGQVVALKTAAEEIASVIQDLEPGNPMVDRGLAFWADLLDADRSVVPAEALIGSGRWTLVKAVDEERWFELIDRTLIVTGGEIDMAVEIAERCKEAQPSSRGLRMLRLMIGHGEPWEQRHIETTGVEALRAAAPNPIDKEFTMLRTRLIERGRHEAAEIAPAMSED